MSQLFSTGQPLLPSRVSDSPFERPSLALSRIIEGDLGGFGRALVAPKTLSPAQRRTLADDFGADEGGAAYEFIIRSVTNPLLLGGIILATRFPIPLAGEMFKYSKRLTGEIRRLGPILRHVSSVDGLYHGTKIPDLYKKLLRDTEVFRKTYNERIGAAIVEAEKSGLKFDRRTEVLLSAKLDGLDVGRGRTPAIFRRPIQVSPQFDKLVNDIRKIQEDSWEQVFGTLEKQYTLMRKQIRKIQDPKLRQSAQAKLAARTTTVLQQFGGQWIGNADLIKKLKLYFPHQWSRKARLLQKDFEAGTEQLIRSAEGRESVYGSQAYAGSAHISSPHVLLRRGGMVPDPEDLKLVEDLLKPNVLTKLEAATKGITKVSKSGQRRFVQPKPYSLRFLEVMSSYNHSLARAWGFSIADATKASAGGRGGVQSLVGTGEKLIDEVTKLEKVDPVRASWMKNSYIPMAMGRLTFRQAMSAAAWNQWKTDASKWIATHKDKLSRWVPNSVLDWVDVRLREDRGLFSLQNLGGRTAGYLYLSALGGNPVSAAWNLMQLILTTVPVIGPKYTAQGLESVFRNAPKYFRARSSGMSHIQALQKVFPDFVEQNLAGTPVSEEAIGRAMSSAWDVSLKLPTRGGEAVDRVKSALMALFSGSENVVRLATYEGAKAKALVDGLKGADVSEFARRVTEATQFLGGPAHVPAIMREWNPLFQQFGRFPARTLAFMLGEGTELGSAARSIPGWVPYFGGRNLGTIGRMAAASALTYEAGRSFADTDLSHGLLFGALPIPNPRAPFAPAIVPPALSIAGGVAQDVLHGEFEQTKFALPLLVPGGVAVSRAISLVSQDAAKTLGRDFVDWSAPSQDGRYPVHSPEGALRGYMTPLQIWMKALGLPVGVGAEHIERETEAYLLAQRDRIRSYRKSFIEAIVDGDSRRATAIKDEFERVYPGWGGLQAKASDIRAVYMRRAVPRLERLLDTIPEEYRAQFGQVIGTALALEGESFLGVDPLMLQQPGTATTRDVWRDAPTTNPAEILARRRVQAGARFQPRQGVGSGGRNNLERYNRTRQLGYGAYNGFGSTVVGSGPPETAVGPGSLLGLVAR